MRRIISKSVKCFLGMNPHSLQVKIFLICLTIALCVMVLSSQVVYLSAAKAIENNAYNYIYESMKYADSNLDIMIQDAKNISLAIATNKDTVLENVLNATPVATYPEFLQKKAMENYLSSFITNKTYVNMVSVITTNGRCFQSGGTILTQPIHQKWIDTALEKPSVQIIYSIPENKQIFLCRPMRYREEIIAVVLIELNYDILKKVYNVAPLEQAQILTLTSEGNVIFNNNETSDILNVSETSLGKSIQEYDTSRKYYTIDNVKKLMVLYHSSISQLTTVGTISYNKLIIQALSIRSIMLIIFIVCLVLAVFFSWYFSRFICRNIQSLKNDMIQIQNGDLNVRSNIKGLDEIGEMAKIFDHMMDHIQTLMTEIKQKESQKRKAEQLALQSQIQPHFVYNAINSIKYVAHMRGEMEIEQVSIALVQLLRSVLGNTAEFIPLWQEREYIEDYICIQQFKSRQGYTVVWDVDDDLWDFFLPKLLLQPIVENAIIHGIAQKEDGCVEIQVFYQSGEVHIKITDNGKGMNQNEIDLLMCEEDQEQIQFRYVGIANVFNRIQTIYGNEFGGEITSFPGAFTCVELRLPMPKKEELKEC